MKNSEEELGLWANYLNIEMYNWNNKLVNFIASYYHLKKLEVGEKIA